MSSANRLATSDFLARFSEAHKRPARLHRSTAVDCHRSRQILARPDRERCREPLRAAKNRPPIGPRISAQFLPARGRLGLQHVIVALRGGQLVASKSHEVARRAINAPRADKQTLHWPSSPFGLRLITTGAFDVQRRLIGLLLRTRIADSGRLKTQRLKNLLAQHVVELATRLSSRNV